MNVESSFYSMRKLDVRIVISVVAVAIVLVRVFVPEMFDGIDLIAVCILALAILPWTSKYISKLSILGMFEAELRQIEEKADQAISAAREAGTKSEELFIQSNRQSVPGTAPSGLEELASIYMSTRAK